jgi:hypothetical protein
MSNTALVAVETWNEWAILVGSMLSTLVLTVAAINRWVVQPLDRNRERSLREIVETSLEPVSEQLNTITREVEVNSGKSLKDKVILGFTEVDDRLGRLEGQVEIIRDVLTTKD